MYTLCEHLLLHTINYRHNALGIILNVLPFVCQARGAALAGGTALQAVKSRVGFPMVSFEFLTQSFRPEHGPGLDSASNRNEYQEYSLEGNGGRCVGLTTLPPSCADFLEI
jgi:hypothetical protein